MAEGKGVELKGVKEACWMRILEKLKTKEGITGLLKEVFRRGLIPVLLLLVFVTWSFAEEKKYPLYPDVWGVELPVSESVDYAGIDVIKMPDGDYMVIYTADWRYLTSRKAKDFDPSKHKIGKFASYSIFSSKKTEFSSDEDFNNFMKTMRDEGREIKSYPAAPIVFSDGSSMKQMPEGGGSPKGSNPIDWYLEKKDKNGKVLFQKKLLYIYDKPRREKMLSSERNQNYKGEYYLERVNTLMEMTLIRLEDDTFIIVGLIEHKQPKSIVIIRFDKELKTKSDLINKKLFLMDESIYKKIQSPPIDDNKAHKLLYEYLTKHKKEGSYGNPK
jgi:hypothetical protein